MEIDQNFMQAFILQYYCDRKIIKCEYKRDLVKPHQAINLARNCMINIEYIQLRSIDNLSDEECEIGSKILGEPTISAFKSFSEKIKLNLWISENRYKPKNLIGALDYLRSIGVACSFRGVTVDEMIKEGILKLDK